MAQGKSNQDKEGLQYCTEIIQVVILECFQTK
jgi:hypothetical protein